MSWIRGEQATAVTDTAGSATSIVSPWSTSGTLGQLMLTELYETLDGLDQIPITRRQAMSVPTVAKCRKVLATTLARMPVRLLDDGGSVVKERPGLAPVHQPEPGRPAAVTYAWTADALMFFGRGWLVVTGRWPDRTPGSFEFVPEWKAVLAPGGGQLIGHTDGRTFLPEDVIRIDGLDEGVLTFGSRTLRAAILLERAYERMASNPVPAIDLHNTSTDPIGDDEIDKLIARWTAARAKSAVGYTSATLEAKPLAMKVEQLLIEGRKAAALDVVRTMGFPAWVADVELGGSSISYSNVPARSRELMDLTVYGYTEPIAQRLSMPDVQPQGFDAWFDPRALLRGDFGDRMTAYKDAADSGVYNVEELRDMEQGL